MWSTILTFSPSYGKGSTCTWSTILTFSPSYGKGSTWMWSTTWVQSCPFFLKSQSKLASLLKKNIFAHVCIIGESLVQHATKQEVIRTTGSHLYNRKSSVQQEVIHTTRSHPYNRKSYIQQEFIVQQEVIHTTGSQCCVRLICSVVHSQQNKSSPLPRFSHRQ